MDDQPGTIDPAALNSASTISPNLLTQPSPARGTKRSRSPDSNGVHGIGKDTDDVQSNKRSKSQKVTETPAASAQRSRHAVQTPQISAQSLPQTSPMQTSPVRSTPGSSSKTVKALPTVRDHTTDQLAPEGDEWIPRELDPEGETKVTKEGEPLDGRKFRCRTFKVPNRGEKLFMLATECARVLGYRDSYLLFNKNRSLYKIIASQIEKDSLIHQEVLPYSYRSRQIAIVTARSMFRQFGSRVIENGRRVRDDYWVAKAIKQGFTEADAAGEKRPGGGKAREAAAAEAMSAIKPTMPQGQVIYAQDISDPSATMDHGSGAPLPMIHLATDDVRPSYGGAVRPRQEINSPPYQDRSQPSGMPDILLQASQAAEFNKQISQGREHRSNYLQEFWRRTHDQPAVEPPPELPTASSTQPDLHSPQAVSHMSSSRMPQDSMAHPSSGLLPQPYPSYPNQQNPMASPVQAMHRQLPQMHQGSPVMSAGGGGSASTPHRQPPPPNYGGYGTPSAMWSQPQQTPGGQGQQPTHPSPHAQPQHHLMQQYGQQQQMLPPHMSQSNPMAAYGQMGGMGSNPQYMGRSMYQPSPAGSGQQTPHYQPPGSQPQAQGQGWSGSAGSMGGQDWPSQQQQQQQQQQRY